MLFVCIRIIRTASDFNKVILDKTIKMRLKNPKPTKKSQATGNGGSILHT